MKERKGSSQNGHPVDYAIGDKELSRILTRVSKTKKKMKKGFFNFIPKRTNYSDRITMYLMSEPVKASLLDLQKVLCSGHIADKKTLKLIDKRMGDIERSAYDVVAAFNVLQDYIEFAASSGLMDRTELCQKLVDNAEYGLRQLIAQIGE